MKIKQVIEDKLIKANILPDRDREIEAVSYVWKDVPKENIIKLPEACHVEGGDVMPWNEYIFVGTYYGEDYQCQGECLAFRLLFSACRN